MTELEVRTAGGVRTKRLSATQTALVGPRDAVRDEVARMRAAAYPVRFDRPMQLDRSSDVSQVLTLLPPEQRQPVGPLLPWYQRPRLVVTWVGSVCALVLSVGAAVTWILGAVAALWPLLLTAVGAVAVGAVVLALVKSAGGPSAVQNNHFH
jgi:hypothetical protein